MTNVYGPLRLTDNDLEDPQVLKRIRDRGVQSVKILRSDGQWDPDTFSAALKRTKSIWVGYSARAAEILQRCPNASHVTIANMDLRDTLVVSMIAAALKHTSTELTHLSIRDVQLGTAGLCAIWTVLPRFKQLRSLCMQTFKLSEREIRLMLEAAYSCSAIERLKLKDFRAEGLIARQCMFAFMPALKVLDLTIADILTVNSCKELDSAFANAESISLSDVPLAVNIVCDTADCIPKFVQELKIGELTAGLVARLPATTIKRLILPLECEDSYLSGDDVNPAAASAIAQNMAVRNLLGLAGTEIIVAGDSMYDDGVTMLVVTGDAAAGPPNDYRQSPNVQVTSLVKHIEQLGMYLPCIGTSMNALKITGVISATPLFGDPQRLNGPAVDSRKFSVALPLFLNISEDALEAMSNEIVNCRILEYALTQCANLSTLILSHLMMSDLQAELMVLVMPQTIEVLRMDNNRVGERTANAIELKLTINGQSLRELNLYDNPLGDKGGLIVLGCMVLCPNLQVLNLAQCGMGAIVADRLPALLPLLLGLQRFYVHGNDFTPLDSVSISGVGGPLQQLWLDEDIYDAEP